VKISIIKKGHFYNGLSKDSYNRNNFMVKKWDDNNLLNAPKNHSQFQNVDFKTLKIQNFKTSRVLYHI